MAQTASPIAPNINERELKRLLARKRTYTDQQLSQMAADIKPVVDDNGTLCYIEPVDPKGVSFTFDPELTIQAKGLGEFARIITLHRYGYMGYFKPSIAEVLSMIPDDMVKKTKAFQTIGPDDYDDLLRQKPAIDAGYHAATTVLYA